MRPRRGRRDGAGYTRRAVRDLGDDPQSVLVLTSGYEPAFRGGGPIQTLKALVAAAPESFRTVVVTNSWDLGGEKLPVDSVDAWARVGKARVRYTSRGVRPLLRALGQTRQASIVYLNSFFSPRYGVVPFALYRLGFWPHATLLLAPRGEFSEGALALKPAKKAAYITLFRALSAQHHAVWHASTADERDDLERVMGPGLTVVVRENETTLPPTAVEPISRTGTPFQLLFASRASRKKGLLTLLRALALMPRDSRLLVEVVGEFEEDEYRAQCVAEVSKLPGGVEITFRGALPRDEVLALMNNSDLLALPTEGENFGHVIAEALSQSCPVACSDFTPWSARLRGGGGEVVDPNTATEWAGMLELYLDRGRVYWEERRREAGESFSLWQAETKGKHVFELVRESP